MADDKKPQTGTISEPPKRPNEPETETITASPPGRKPPNVIGDTEFVVTPEPEATGTGPPGGTKTPTEVEAGSADKQPPNVIRGVEYVVAPQPKPQPRGRLAQEIRPTRTRVTTEYKPEQEYFQKDRDRIAELKEIVAELPPGPKKEFAQNLENKAIGQAKKNVEEKDGPVPVENLPIIKKMIGEFKDFYYQGYAKVVEAAKIRAGEQAWNAEYGQKQAIQYGMSSLTDLHRGLDLASWNFFFKILGPLGSILEHYHQQKIGWDMAYYGRSWWSPYRIDYLIKTLPEEKAFNLAYDAFRNTIYYVNKIAGSPIFSKTATYDRFGRKLTKDFIVFTPLLKMQKGLNVVGVLADNLSQRNTYAISLAFQKYQEDKKKFRNNPTELKKAKGDWITFKNDNGDKIRNKLARVLGVGTIGRNIRKTHRDPLSFLAILIGEWLFDVIVGNLFRTTLGAIAERLAASKLGIAMQEFFSGKYMTAGKMLGGGLVEAGRAVFSVNTLGGGLIGYQIGGVPGAIIGSGGGWFWQTVRNFGLDAARMEWTGRYLDMLKGEKYFGSKFLSKEFILGPEVKLTPSLGKFFDFKWNFAGKTFYPFRSLLTPGPISRFAHFLNYGGDINLFGKTITVPSQIANVFRTLPSTAINGTLIRWYVSPFLTQLGIQLGWPSFVLDIINSGPFQYGLPFFWEYKGVLFNTLGERLLFEWKPFLGTSEIYNVSYIRGGPGVGFVFDDVGRIEYVAYETETPGLFRFVKPTGFYRGALQIRVNVANYYERTIGQPLSRTIQSFLQQHQTINSILNKTGNYFGNLQKVGLTNFAGFIIGWELAALIPGAPFWLPLAGGIAGWFGLNPILNFIATRFGLVNFIPMFSTGFWLGAGVQFVAGFFGINLPFLFPIVTGFLFAASPAIFSFIGGLAGGMATATGAFFVGLGTSLAASTASLVALTTVLAVTSVAALAVFSIIIIGSAFWVPISENLKGLTATSPCFDISSPTFTDINNNSSNAIFTTGETKTVCWTTTNKTDFYQDAITKTKTWEPPSNFTMEKYSVTVTTPGGQPIVWNNTSGSSGNYNLSVDPITFATPGTFGLVNGQKFTIALPKNTALATQQAAQQIRQIYDQLNNKTSPITKEELIAEAVLPTIIVWVNSNYLRDAELDYLNAYINSPQAAINSEAGILNHLKTANTGGYIVYHASNSSLPGSGDINNAMNMVLMGCSQWQQKINAVPPPSPLPTAPYSSCDSIMKSLGDINSSGPGGNSPYQQMQDFFNDVKGGPASALLLKKDDLSNQPSQLSKNIQSLNGYPSYIDKIKNINPSLTGTALDDAINKLAGQTIENQGNFYLPIGSTITVCLTLKYNGENGKVANIIEKDAANLPFLGPLSVPSCQAQLITPINAAGPGNLQWPTDQRRVTGGYYVNPNNPADPNNHTGVDIGGTPGSPAKAAGSGTIIKEGTDPVSGGKSLGKYIIVQGDDGNYYLYGHLGDNVHGDSAAFIKNVGDKINAGDNIGYLGNSGIVSGPHLHAGISTTASGSGASDFYDNSTTTLNPCGFFQGGCP